MILAVLSVYIFLKELLRGYRENRLFEKAAFLSYLSLVAFIPLLASFVQVYSLFYHNWQEQIHTVVGQVLPYSEEAWYGYFDEFLRQAKHLGTIALIICFAIATNVFFSIEKSLNAIWGITRSRRMAERLGSFTMVLFWGPITLGVLASIQFYLVRAGLLGSTLEFILPKILTLFAFTMLFWTVPATRVRLSSAALGGAVTMIVLALVRYGFLFYLGLLRSANVVSGSLGLILLFAVSINLFWLAILLGVLISYTSQNFSALKAEMEERSIPMERWELFWGLSCVLLIHHRFKGKLAPLTVTELADTFNLQAKRMEHVVQKLIACGLLIEGRHLELGFARDPEDLTVRDVAAALFAEYLQQPPLLPSAHAELIKGVLEKVQGGLAGEAGSIRIAELVEAYASRTGAKGGSGEGGAEASV